MTRPPLLLRTYAGVANIAAPLVFRRIRDRLTAHGVTPQRARERLGHATQPRPNGALVWFHGASVGETLSALPVIDALLDGPNPPKILVTSGTASSADILSQRLPAGVVHQFAPLDSARVLRRFQAHWQPSLLVLMESEIWPQMIARAPCPVVLLNARLSERALARWSKLGSTAEWLLSRFALITTQTEPTALALQRLGVAPDRVRMGGNLKAAAAPPQADPDALAGLQAALAKRPSWLAASTHAGEETHVLDAHRSLMRDHPDLCLILAPRHPERADRVAKLVQDAGLTVTRRSAGEGPSAQVYLADTLGEMGLWYRLSPLVFLGGALTPNGGHNPWEAAALGAAQITGSHLFNSVRDWQMLVAAEAAIVDLTPVTLPQQLARLLSDDARVAQMGHNATRCAAQQSHDVPRVAAALMQLVNGEARNEVQP